MYQLDLLGEPQPMSMPSEALGLSFRDSRDQPIHRWYPYVEGFASDYIVSLLADAKGSNATVYDPFAGSGTVCVLASRMGLKSAYSELNPFMQFVTGAKVNSARWAKENSAIADSLITDFKKRIRSSELEKQAKTESLDSYHTAFPGRDFFVEQHIRELLAAKTIAKSTAKGAPEVGNLLLVAIASVLVHNSNMTRRADLRRRRDGEYKNRVVDVRKSILEKVDQVQQDIMSAGQSETQFLNANARDFHPDYMGAFDRIITSPPYLNGTNYFRNTKIEMWFTGALDNEGSLTQFNRDCVAGGISNVTNHRDDLKQFSAVEDIVQALSSTNGDKRIGRMVRYYFNDMSDVLRNCFRYLKADGHMILDIGDSKFYGVHVPTDTLLIEASQACGFEVVDVKILARRHSRDKTPLKQVEIQLRRPSAEKRDPIKLVR